MRYCISIGGITIGVRIEEDADARPAVRLDGPVARFVVEDRAADVEVHVTSAQCTVHSAQCTEVFDSGSLWRLFRCGDEYRLEFRSNLSGDDPYKIATIPVDLGAKPVRVALQTRVTEFRSAYPLQFPLDELLVNAMLTQQGCIEIHACGVVDRNGDGYLFAGNSGAGKTTTALLWQNDAAEILSDDRIILRRHEDGWWMYGTPWHGEAEICSASRAPLRHIFLLDKARRNALQRVPAGAAVARLFSCAFPPFYDRTAVSSVIRILSEVVRELPPSSLAFVKDRSVVGFVRGSLEAAA